MKEYFISEINIEKLYHLSNITIELDTTKRQHLLLTGKNGSGKTSLLLRLVRYLKVLKDGHLIRLTGTWPEWEENAKRRWNMLQVRMNDLKRNRITDNGRIGFVSIAMALGLHGMIMMDLKVRIKKENL